jgi:hypothetical protein
VVVSCFDIIKGKGGKRSHDIKIGVDLLPENFEWLRIGLGEKTLK